MPEPHVGEETGFTGVTVPGNTMQVEVAAVGEGRGEGRDDGANGQKSRGEGWKRTGLGKGNG